MRKSSKRALVAVLAAALLAGTGTAAYAYWTATGSGTATAVSGAGVTNLTAASTGTALTGVDPGVAAQTLHLTITNPGTSSAQVTTITPSVTKVMVGGADVSASTCAITNFTVTLPAAVTGGTAVAGGTTSASLVGGTIAFNNNTTVDQSGCKNATVTVGYALS